MQLKKFYSAEEYHQKYYLQGASRLYEELKSMYDNFDEFISSTLTARANGYATGYINMSLLKDELESLEIPQENYNRLIVGLEKLR